MFQSIASSLDELLTSGCDNRLLNTGEGLNRYGCAPRPRDVIPLGSCTCSSPSLRGFQRAASMLDGLRQVKSPESEANRIRQQHRHELRELLNLTAETDIAFTPSGTDIELLVLALVRMTGPRRITNIVVGPTEVGSGTSLAAAGCHYDDLLPNGDHVTTGSPVCQRLAAETIVETIDIRDSQGEILEEALIDAMVTQHVTQAVAQGQHVLLHVVAHSKTGMHAPSLSCVERIARNLKDDVSVVIDAAQGRISRQGLREVLRAQYMVMLTGSKFYGGPPFAGALLVPDRFQPHSSRVANAGTDDGWPDGLDRYLTVAEIPESWTPVRSRLSPWVNYGGLLRWSAALEEIKAYYDVPSQDRLAVLRAFEKSVPDLFTTSQEIRLMPVFPPIYDPDQLRLLESKTTVFAFRVEIGGEYLGREALRRWHNELNRKHSDSSQPSFHLGQPVSFRDGSAALRIALGAELIIRVATDLNLGNSLDERIDWLKDQLLTLRSRLESLVVLEQETSNIG